MFEAFWAWNIMKHARFDLWTGSDFNDQPHLPLLHRWSLPLAKILPTSPSSPNVQLELIRRFGLAVWKSGNSWFYELTNLNCIKTLKNRLLMPVIHSFSNSCIHSFIDTFISFHDIHVIHAIHAIHAIHSFIHSFIDQSTKSINQPTNQSIQLTTQSILSILSYPILSIYLSIFLSFFLSIYLSIYLSVCLSVYLSIIPHPIPSI